MALIFQSLDSIEIANRVRPVHLAVGTFDGVHQGHASLIGRCIGEAHATGGQALVFTFQNHPRSVVTPGQQPKLLTPWQRKRELLERLGLDIIVGVSFTPEFMAMPAADFVRHVLVGKCHARVIHSGWNFRFGKNGYGGPGLLEELADELGYRYERMEPIKVAGRRISSTRIREELAAGQAHIAEDLLGRPHEVNGVVVRGDGIGARIGFPTANLAVNPDVLLPADGVYAVRAGIDGDRTNHVSGMVNLGFRPTVNGTTHRVEAHLFNFSADLVGHTLCVQFIERLRDEIKFQSVDYLREQLSRDREDAIRVLQERKREGNGG